MSISGLPYDQRVEKGKIFEAEVFQKLTRVFPTLEKTTTHQDMKDKLDAKLVWTQEYASLCKRIKLAVGETKYFQIKAREGREDFLFDVYEPFHGIGHPETKVGRDKFGDYDVYVCRTSDGVYFVSALGVKSLIDKAIQEWATNGGKLPGEFTKSSWFHTSMKGVKICVTYDNCNGRRKMLVFISTKAALVYGYKLRENNVDTMN